MTARLFLAALLLFTGVACEKEIHEVRLDEVPQGTPLATDVPAPADRL